jgi:hypothetical protein
MFRRMMTGLTLVVATSELPSTASAQDPSAHCVSLEKRQTTIASAQGHGFDIANFSEIETAAFLRKFNAMSPKTSFVATKMFAAVGRDQARVFFESGADLCTAPFPLSRKGYERLAKLAQGDGA